MPSTAYFFSPTTDPSASVLGSYNARRNAVANPVRPAATTAGGIAGANPFTLNPATQPGVGPYGTVPGPIAKPPSLYQGAQTIYPGLANLTTAAGGNIAAELAGEFSPQTENALWDTANRFGVASGMPGAGLWSNRFMGNVAGAKERLQQQGLSDYSRMLGDLAKTTDDPNLLASIAARNATMAAAPNPEQAAAALAEAYRRAQLDAASRARGPAGGTVGGANLSPGAGTAPSQSPFLFRPQGNTAQQSYSANAYRNNATGAPFMPNTTMDTISNPNLNFADPLFDQPGQNYDPYSGGIPENTFYNPATDQSTYDPFGDVWGQYQTPDSGTIDQAWGDLDQVATGNNYDPYADMSDEDYWAWLNGWDEGG